MMSLIGAHYYMLGPRVIYSIVSGTSGTVALWARTCVVRSGNGCTVMS